MQGLSKLQSLISKNQIQKNIMDLNGIQDLQINPHQENTSYMLYLTLKKQIKLQMEQDKLERLVSHTEFVGEQARFWKQKFKAILQKRKLRIKSKYSIQKTTFYIPDLIFLNTCNFFLMFLLENFQDPNSLDKQNQQSQIKIRLSFICLINSMILQEQIHTFNKDHILNYERDLIESPFENCLNRLREMIPNTQFSELIGDSKYNLRCIGNKAHSHIEAYAYCLLMFCISSSHTLMMFKNVFYQLCRKYLDVKHQKLLIEFLCLLEFSSDKYLFLKKYPIIEHLVITIFIKIESQKVFQFSLQDEAKIQTKTRIYDNDSSHLYTGQSMYQNSTQSSRKDDQSFDMSQVAKIFVKFAKKFDFMKGSKSSGSSFIFWIVDNKKIHIILEKQYFFVLQILEESQIKLPNKLSKSYRVQVQRLLKISRAESEISLHQKLYITPDINKKQSNNLIYSGQLLRNTKAQHNKQSSIEGRVQSSIERRVAKQSGKNEEDTKKDKKDFKYPPFAKKSQKKIQQSQQSQPNQKEFQKPNPYKKQVQIKRLQYIDLMESSFEEQVDEAESNKVTQIKTKQMESLKFYKPKYIPKQITPPIDHKKPHQISPDRIKNGQIFNRSRQPSHVQKHITGLTNRQKDITGLNDGQKDKININLKQMNIKLRQIKLYSPPHHFRESPQKNKFRKQLPADKQQENTVKQKIKQEFKLKQKRHLQRNEQVSNKIRVNADKTSDVKGQFSVFSNNKPINNRISLQSRNDLEFLQRYNTNQTLAHHINEIKTNIKSSDKKSPTYKNDLKSISYKNSFSDKHSSPQNRNESSKDRLFHTLNNKSEFYLKKRIFDHIANKFTDQNFNFEQKGQILQKADIEQKVSYEQKYKFEQRGDNKRNRSVQQKQSQTFGPGSNSFKKNPPSRKKPDRIINAPNQSIKVALTGVSYQNILCLA